MIKGNILNIQRFSIHDGPGIRTTVFLKGCPLNCIWCHNPESISSDTSISYISNKCINCGVCTGLCTNGAHFSRNNKHEFNRNKCIKCQKCKNICSSKAIEFAGEVMTVDKVFQEIKKDVSFYETSNGGLTLSGGEPLLQTMFCFELLKKAKSQNIHTVVETSLFAKFSNLKKIASVTDLFYCDIKEINSKKHKLFTGQSNEIILRNIKLLHDLGSDIIIRYPLIQKFNDSDTSIAELSKFLQQLPNIKGVEILKYNPSEKGKKKQFGLKREFQISATDQEHKICEIEDKLHNLDIKIIKHRYTNKNNKKLLLSKETHNLAKNVLRGDYTNQMIDFFPVLSKDKVFSNLSACMKYAYCIKLFAENAPLIFHKDELIIGSASFRNCETGIFPVEGLIAVDHTTIGFDKILLIGYSSLRNKVLRRLRDINLTENQKEYLHSMLLCLDAADIWHGRYINELIRKIKETDCIEEKIHLNKILKISFNVPNKPPKTFHEAVQSLWFMFTFQRQCFNRSSIGRIDCILGDYLENDLRNKTITIFEAREILSHFWIKSAEWDSFRKKSDMWVGDNIVLSGIDSDNKDITNNLTYLALDIIEELQIPYLSTYVRVSERTPNHLMKRIARIIRQGNGILSIYNEDVIIEALTKYGFSLVEARNFANDGCWETMIPGATTFTYTQIDILEILQNILHDTSVNDISETYPDFESLYNMFNSSMQKEIKQRQTVKSLTHNINGSPNPLLSLFVDGCIKNAADYRNRGAKYTMTAVHATCLQEAANSLLALRNIVYINKELKLNEFIKILKDNWANHEPLRRKINNEIEFYGNDNIEADSLLQNVYNNFTTCVNEVKVKNGLYLPAGISTFVLHLEYIKVHKATAAGLYANEMTGTNFSPTPRTDLLGPTAVIKSFCSVDYTKLPGVTALDLELLPDCVEGEVGLKALTNLIKTFIKLKGVYLQINVMDIKKLLDAQKNPEKYPNLTIRVSGWSARFNNLTTDVQNMVINRMRS